jgi:hypothetical protein
VELCLHGAMRLHCIQRDSFVYVFEINIEMDFWCYLYDDCLRHVLGLEPIVGSSKKALLYHSAPSLALSLTSLRYPMSGDT